VPVDTNGQRDKDTKPGAYLEGAEGAPPGLMQIAWHESLKFGQLTLGKINKIVATECQILRLKCTKFNFGRGSAPDLAGRLTALPRPLSWIKGAYF